ncbi:hypothetical protein DFH08DRAFT_1090243 [Mycena albidolilacea]|uniref:Uncharacterized protein n=1 Tax=Mycena albidolilacea TaxID=1033008 RepID=A0AAD6YXW4_9AGAR|nr:hypothetical protein DFH08DRAFT_1090243 [Mycena albidolilacea]
MSSISRANPGRVPAVSRTTTRRLRLLQPQRQRHRPERDGSSDARAPMLVLGNILPGGEIRVDGGSHGGEYPDELTLVLPCEAAHQTHPCESDDEPNDPADPKGKRRRVKSDSSTTSTRGCNADAASQLARSVDSLSAAMLKPIVTTQDISYVDNVMLVLNDPTTNLLPPDPRGKLFNLVSKALTASQTQARIFILASDHSRRRGIITGILEDAGVEVPGEYYVGFLPVYKPF